MECLRQLEPLRELCEKEMREDLFTNAQEKEFVNDVLKSCRDAKVWCFIVFVGHWIMQPLEHVRRWGLVCPCKECNDRRHAGEKNVKCPKALNGRRLHQAWEFIQDQIKSFRQSSRSVPVAACEGSILWSGIVRNMCASAASELRLAFKYINNVPWSFARADTIKGAEECIHQINARPLADHDPFHT